MEKQEKLERSPNRNDSKNKYNSAA